MVTDAAGTGFEIKKPHKGTETSADMPLIVTLIDLKLRNPIRGRKLYFFYFLILVNLFEIKKPHKGTETIPCYIDNKGIEQFEIKKPHKGTETKHRLFDNSPWNQFEIKKPHKGTETCQKLLFYCDCSIYLKLRNPIRGRKLCRCRLSDSLLL